MAQKDMIIIQPRKLSWYRPDIDGLRALAVLGVVIFHAFPELFPGGFVGVDIFFVISGFLISGIVFRQLDDNSFRFSEFYSKRVRRIFPSLLLVLGFCYLMGWCLLLKDEFVQLSTHILGGAGFASNFVLWGEAGYFDATAELKPLLHLWSLGIEEQFYILFPAIFAIASKKSWSRTTTVIGFLLLSFALNIALYQSYPTATFYAPWTRFWEILSGSALALIYPRWQASEAGQSKLWPNVAAVAGLICMLIAFALPNKDTPFPGWFAILPVLASFLLMGAGMKAFLNRRFLALPLLQWVGRISYPLYLWHWPLLVFAHIGKSETPSPFYRFGVLALSVLLSWLSYLLVENRLRFGGHNRKKVTWLAFAMIFFALLSFATMRMAGIFSRTVNELNFQSAFQNLNSKLDFIAPGCGIEKPELAERIHLCQHDTRQTPRIAVLGDSKAQALVYGLYQQSDLDSRVLIIGGTGDNPAPLPLLTDAPAYRQYQAPIKIALEALIPNQDIQVVIIVAATRALYVLKSDSNIEDLPQSPNQEIVVAGLSAVIEKLVDHGKKVILTVDNPTLPEPRECIARKSSLAVLNSLFQVREKTCSISYERQLELSHKYRLALLEMERRFAGKVKIFDTLPLLCDGERKVCSSMQDGQPNYGYTDHISHHAADRIARSLIPFAKKFGGLGPSILPQK